MSWSEPVTYQNHLHRIDISVNEYILVEFIAEHPNDATDLMAKLIRLGTDFEWIDKSDDLEEDEDGNLSSWIKISGKINSAYASVIKLQDPFLADRMRISYIPDDLKDKYRRWNFIYLAEC